MATSLLSSFADWRRLLLDIRLNETDITEDLVSTLAAYDFSPFRMNDESFQGYFTGETEEEAGINVAKDFASLGSLDWFLETAVDWVKAWTNIKTGEGYILVPASTVNSWALFYKNAVKG